MEKNKVILLKGEGVHQHVLRGDFEIQGDPETSVVNIQVKKNTLLKHETPAGTFGEHNTLTLSPGQWSMGKQVEFNPFTKKVERVWD